MPELIDAWVQARELCTHMIQWAHMSGQGTLARYVLNCEFCLPGNVLPSLHAALPQAAAHRQHVGLMPGCCMLMLQAACLQGTGKDLIQPVLDNQLKASSPLVLPAEVIGPPLDFPFDPRSTVTIALITLVIAEAGIGTCQAVDMGLLIALHSWVILR